MSEITIPPPELIETEGDKFTFKLRIDTSEAEAALDSIIAKAEQALAAIKAVEDASR